MRQAPDTTTILVSLEGRLARFKRAEATGDPKMRQAYAWRLLFGAMALLQATGDGLHERSEFGTHLAAVYQAILTGRTVAPCPTCAHPAIQPTQDPTDWDSSLVECLHCRDRQTV